MTNKENAKSNNQFISDCSKANAKPTHRQFSKWKRGFGKVRGLDRVGRKHVD